MSLLDLVSQYTVQLIIGIIAVIIAELLLHYYFESKHPDIQITHLTKAFSSDETWTLAWQIFNKGSITATGVDADLEIHETSGYPQGLPLKRFKMFSGLDIMPERVRNDEPPTIVIGYVSHEAKFMLFQPMSHMSMDSLEVKQGATFEVFPSEASTSSEPHIPLGYEVEVMLTGQNLTDKDRRTHRYLITAGYDPKVKKPIPYITELDEFL